MNEHVVANNCYIDTANYAYDDYEFNCIVVEDAGMTAIGAPKIERREVVDDLRESCAEVPARVEEARV